MAGGGDGDVLARKVARCDDKLIEMAVEGGEELSLLSRSISAFSQFLPVLNLLALQYKSTNTDAERGGQVLNLLALLVQKYKY